MPRMLPDGRRLGAHLPLGNGMVKAVDRAHEIGAERDPGLRRQPDRVAPPTAAAGRAAGVPRPASTELDIAPVAVHASYLVNLAGVEEDFFGRSVTVLASDLRAAPGFGGPVRQRPHRVAPWRGRRGRHGAPGRWARAYPGRGRSTLRTRPMIALENSPGSGFGLGTDVDRAGRHRRGRRGARPAARADRVLSRHRARVGGRHRRLRARRDRCLPGRLRRSDRSRPARDDPPQRLEVGARLAARSP